MVHHLLCDPNSSAERRASRERTPNAPRASNQGGGAAFLELQFYAPGFAPFPDSISCDNSHWCSALTIDSLECDASGDCNDDCVEPVNFAFIQRDGSRPDPEPAVGYFDLLDAERATRCLINPGDVVVIHMFNARLPGGGHALEIERARSDDPDHPGS